MKFRITFKTPDAIRDAINQICPHPRHTKEEYDEQDVENYQDHLYNTTEEVNSVAKKFIQYGEYVTIEFDSKTGSATVIPIGK